MVNLSKKTVPVQLTAHELALLTNALNEAREAIDDWEFESRLGASQAEADDLRRKLSSIRAALEISDR